MGKKKKNLDHKRNYKAERAIREKKREQALSRRAKKASESGRERPYNDWNYKDLMSAIEKDCRSLSCRWNRSLIANLPFGFIKHAFLTRTSRHHIGSDLVDFYSIDHVSIYECFGDGNADALSKLSEALHDDEEHQWDVAFGDDPADTEPVSETSKAHLRREFEERCGYAPNSVFAFMEAHPDKCTFDFNDYGERTVTVPVGKGKNTYTCTIASAKEQFLVDFDATAPEQEEKNAELQLENDAKWLTRGIDVDVRDAVKILVEERERYQKAYGFPSNSVLAYQNRFPERVELFVLGNTKKLKVHMKKSSFVCREADADITFVKGFDAVFGKVRARAEKLSDPLKMF